MGYHPRAEIAPASLRWSVTVGAVLIALAAALVVWERIATYVIASRGASLYTSGEIGRAYPLLQRAVGATRHMVRPCVVLGDLAVWALDDGVFQRFYEIDDPWSLARLAFLSYAEALDRKPSSSKAWAGLGELFKKTRVLRIKEGTVDLDLLGGERSTSYDVEDRLAIAAYERALWLEPNNYFYHAYLGDLLDERGFRERALESYARAIEIMPDLSWHYYLPVRDVPADLYRAARAGLERALDRAAYPRDRILQNLAALAERSGMTAEAAETYQRAAAAALDPSPYLLMLGNLYFTERRYEEARPVLEQAIERATLLPEKQALAHTLLGRCARLRGDLEQAVEHLQQARWLNPAAAYAAVDLGRTYEELGKFDLAEAEYRSAIDIDPSRASAYSALIEMYRRTRQINKAIPLAEKLVEMFPDHPVFKSQLQRLTRELGRPDAS